MAEKTIVSLDLNCKYLEEIMGFDFDELKDNLEILSQQPHVEVDSCYKDIEINYKEGYRLINVKSDSGRLLRFSYTVMDRANVKGSADSQFVGKRIYTQQEVEELRSQAG